MTSPETIDWEFYAGVGFENSRDLYQPARYGDSDEEVFEWCWALERFDDEGDKQELVALLRSEHPLPRTAREYLADFLARYRLIIQSQLTGRLGEIIEVPEENKRDKQAIIQRLALDDPFPLTARAELADVVVEYEFKRRQGKQPRPLYRMPNSEWVLDLARYEVRRRRRTLKIADAIAQVARERHIKIDVLRNSWEGRRGYTQKMKQVGKPTSA